MSLRTHFLWVLGLMVAVCASAQDAAQGIKDTSVVNGLVVNSITGQPLKKAFVIAQRTTEVRGVAGRSSGAQVAQTAADGRFMLTLSPGRYSLRVTRNGYLDQGYSQAHSAAAPNTLTLAPGQQVTDLVFKLVPMGVVAGHVYDEDGEAVRNVNVQALRRSFSNGRWQLVVAASASTNDLGEYRLIGLSPAKYYLCIVYNGYVAAGAKDNYVPLCYSGSIGVSATPVDVSPGREVSRVNFDLRPIHTVGVRGRVLLGATGEPVAGANVALMRREAQWSGSQVRAITDAAGTFELHAVPPGAYVLRATWFNKDRLISGRATVEVGNEEIQNVKLLVGSGSEITGQVRAEGNSPLNLGSLRVTVQPQEEFEPSSPGARVEPTGTFVLRDLPPGVYSVSVCCPGGDFYLRAASMGNKDVLEGGLTVGAEEKNEPLDLLMTPLGGHIQGMVLDKTKPVAEATVALVPEPNRRNQPRLYFSALTDDAGRFTMRGVPPGLYTLFAWERIEESAYREADTLRRFERLGKAVRVDGGKDLIVDTQVIRAQVTERGK